MNRNLIRIIKTLPFAFLVHNIEEAVAIEKTSSPLFTMHKANITQFIIAVTLFTILGFVVVFGKKFFQTQKHYQYAVIGFTGMLFLNAFFPHILSAIIFRAYTPGVATATLLILPLTSIILWKTCQSNLFPNKSLIITILSGGIVGVILVAVFLGIGYIFS